MLAPNKQLNPKYLRQKLYPVYDDAIRAEDKIQEGPDVCYENVAVIGGGKEEEEVLKMETLEEMGILKEIRKNLEDMNIRHLRSVQKAVIPLITSRLNDVVAFARTGNGKTIAYLISVIHLLVKRNIKDSSCLRKPRVVILVRNHETAIEIHKLSLKIARGLDINIRTALGNCNLSNELHLMNQGTDMIIATIGRFMDYLQGGKMPVEKIKTLVFDDIDQFLCDDQWKSNLKFIKEHLPPRPRTLLFSATYEKGAGYQDFLKKDCWKITVGKVNQVNPLIHQHFIMLTPNSKFQKVFDLLKSKAVNGRCPKTIIFINNTDKSDFIVGRLNFCRDPSLFNIRSASCHSQVGHQQRDMAMNRFKADPEVPDSIDVIVASDKISCGISTPAKLVINFEVPWDTSTYILRVGRTGRNGHHGEAYTLITEADLQFRERKAEKQLIGILKIAKQSQHDPFCKELESFYETGKLVYRKRTFSD